VPHQVSLSLYKML